MTSYVAIDHHLFKNALYTVGPNKTDLKNEITLENPHEIQIFHERTTYLASAWYEISNRHFFCNEAGYFDFLLHWSSSLTLLYRSKRGFIAYSAS